MKPMLKWAGGKTWQLPTIKTLWDQLQQQAPAPKRLVEPFCGGAAIALGIEPKLALLNDVNPHLMNLYQYAANGLEVDLEMRNDSDMYYKYRAMFNDVALQNAEPRLMALLFYYLNRTGFNGLCRFNKKGQFNVPFGKRKTLNYRDDFHDYEGVMKHWLFTCGDFERLQLTSYDFVYADPPYDVEFTQYAAGGFSWADQERLAAWLAKHPGPVVLTNQATKRIQELYRDHGFHLHMTTAPRRISCTGDRTPAAEVMATKNISRVMRFCA